MRQVLHRGGVEGLDRQHGQLVAVVDLVRQDLWGVHAEEERGGTGRVCVWGGAHKGWGGVRWGGLSLVQVWRGQWCVADASSPVMPMLLSGSDVSSVLATACLASSSQHSRGHMQTAHTHKHIGAACCSTHMIIIKV